MGKRLTYEQRVKLKLPNAYCITYDRVNYILSNPANTIYPYSNICTRHRDAWRSAWRTLRRKK